MLWYYMHYCLVGGLEHFFIFRGVETINQLLYASARSQAEYLSWRPPQRPEHLGYEDRSGSRINHRFSRKGGLRFYHTGWWFGTWILFFPYIGNNRAPTDFHIIMIPTDELIIFQRGRYTTNQNVLDMYWTCCFVSAIQFWGQFQVELLEIRPAWQSPHSDHRQRMSHQIKPGFSISPN